MNRQQENRTQATPHPFEETTTHCQRRFVAVACYMLACFLAGLTTALPPKPAFAQNAAAGGSNQRRELLQDLLNQLLETQLDPSDASRESPEISQQTLRQVRANLAGLAQEISKLTDVLYRDLNRTPGIRSLLGDTLRVSASANLLVRQSASTDNLRPIRENYQQLDQQWRLLVHRLNQLRYLSDAARDPIRQADRYNQRLGQLLGTGPQVNHGELTRQAATLSAELLGLLEETDFEITDTRLRLELLRDGRVVYEQGRQIATLAQQQADYETLKRQYDRFRDLWLAFAGRVRALEQPLLDRHVRRVQTADHRLQELLWLSPGLDRDELRYQTQILRRELDALLDGVTLRQLIAMPDGHQRMVAHASAFDSACSDFSECIVNGEDQETLVEVFLYLHDQWLPLASSLEQAADETIRQRDREIDQAVRELRNVLNVRPTLDRQRAAELAAHLGSLVLHYRNDVSAALSGDRSNYSARYRSEFVRVVNQLQSETAAFNALLDRRAEISQLRTQSAVLLPLWQQASQYADNLRSPDREHILRVRQRITPLLVDLQAMFAAPEAIRTARQ